MEIEDDCKTKFSKHTVTHSVCSKMNAGITLIALVITIIVLLILAGVSISIITGENGILTKTTEAKLKTENATVLEYITLQSTGEKMHGLYGQDIIKELKDKNVLEENGKVINTEQIIGENNGKYILSADGSVIYIDSLYGYTKIGYVDLYDGTEKIIQYNNIINANITIINGDIVSVESVDNFTGTFIKVTIKYNITPDGKKFSHWEDDWGNIISYKDQYTIHIGEEATFTPIFVDVAETVTKQNIVFVKTTQNTDSTKLSFLGIREIKSDFTVVEHGLILIDRYITEDRFIIGATDVLKGTATTADNSGVYKVNKNNVSIGDRWYARAYVTIKNNTSGVETTIYSNIISLVKE